MNKRKRRPSSKVQCCQTLTDDPNHKVNNKGTNDHHARTHEFSARTNKSYARMNTPHARTNSFYKRTDSPDERKDSPYAGTNSPHENTNSPHARPNSPFIRANSQHTVVTNDPYARMSSPLACYNTKNNHVCHHTENDCACHRTIILKNPRTVDKDVTTERKIEIEEINFQDKLSSCDQTKNGKRSVIVFNSKSRSDVITENITQPENEVVFNSAIKETSFCEKGTNENRGKFRKGNSILSKLLFDSSPESATSKFFHPTEEFNSRPLVGEVPRCNIIQGLNQDERNKRKICRILSSDVKRGDQIKRNKKQREVLSSQIINQRSLSTRIHQVGSPEETIERVSEIKKTTNSEEEIIPGSFYGAINNQRLQSFHSKDQSVVISTDGLTDYPSQLIGIGNAAARDAATNCLDEFSNSERRSYDGINFVIRRTSELHYEIVPSGQSKNKKQNTAALTNSPTDRLNEKAGGDFYSVISAANCQDDIPSGDLLRSTKREIAGDDLSEKPSSKTDSEYAISFDSVMKIPDQRNYNRSEENKGTHGTIPPFAGLGGMSNNVSHGLADSVLLLSQVDCSEKTPNGNLVKSETPNGNQLKSKTVYDNQEKIKKRLGRITSRDRLSEQLSIQNDTKNHIDYAVNMDNYPEKISNGDKVRNETQNRKSLKIKLIEVLRSRRSSIQNHKKNDYHCESLTRMADPHEQIPNGDEVKSKQKISNGDEVKSKQKISNGYEVKSKRTISNGDEVKSKKQTISNGDEVKSKKQKISNGDEEKNNKPKILSATKLLEGSNQMQNIRIPPKYSVDFDSVIRIANSCNETLNGNQRESKAQSSIKLTPVTSQKLTPITSQCDASSESANHLIYLENTVNSVIKRAKISDQIYRKNQTKNPKSAGATSQLPKPKLHAQKENANNRKTSGQHSRDSDSCDILCNCCKVIHDERKNPFNINDNNWPELLKRNLGIQIVNSDISAINPMPQITQSAIVNPIPQIAQSAIVNPVLLIDSENNSEQNQYYPLFVPEEKFSDHGLAPNVVLHVDSNDAPHISDSITLGPALPSDGIEINDGWTYVVEETNDIGISEYEACTSFAPRDDKFHLVHMPVSTFLDVPHGICLEEWPKLLEILQKNNVTLSRCVSVTTKTKKLPGLLPIVTTTSY